MIEQLTKNEAIEKCLNAVTYKNLGETKYNKFRQYKARHNNGTLKENAIQALFKEFGVIEQCTYTIDPSRLDGSNESKK